MAYDTDMHELATRFPGSVLTLLGRVPRGRYTVEGINVKSERRIDLVFTSADARDPTIYLEWQANPTADVEQRALAEVSAHCLQTGKRRPVEVAIVYADQATRDRSLAADVEHDGGRSIAFTPTRVILTQLAPELLLAAGGPALIALPLVGPEERVRERAREWLGLACSQARREDAEAVKELFLKLLAWRLGTMAIEALKGLEGVMEETGTGQALLAKGEARGEARGRVVECRHAVREVVATRFGALPDGLSARLEAETDLDRLQELLRVAIRVESLADFEEAFPAPPAP